MSAKSFRLHGLPWLILTSLLLPCMEVSGAEADPAVVPLLRIEGVDGTLLDNLQTTVTLPAEACDSTNRRLQRYLPTVRREAITALNALGYYHAQLSSRFEAEGECWQLVLTIAPGEPVRFRTVSVSLTGDAAVQALFAPLVAQAPIRTGAVLHHGAYENLKDALGNTAADQGYFDARFTEAVIALDLPEKAADLNLVFDPGQRYRFGAVTFSRPGVLSEELIQRLFPLQEGEDYAADKLVELRAALDKSLYFQRIRVSPRLQDAKDRTIPVDIELALRPRHAWTGSLGFTTDTGPRARLSYENRYINSLGHRLTADTSISQIRSQLDGSYSIPLNHRFAELVRFTAGFVAESNESYESKRFQTGISLPSENAWGWQQTISLDLQRDDYEFPSSEDVSGLLLPGFSLNKSRADDFINPTRGWKVLASLKGANRGLLSSSSFVQFYSSAKLVGSFGPVRVLTRAELGATWIDETEELPASLRYFAGGDQSVRGFDFRALGPLAEDGSVLGGKQLAVASVEMDYQVRNNWRLAFFTDAGNAFDNKHNIEVRYSAGIGLRWKSPIGPVRFDLAHPFAADESFRIHITMGPDL